MKSLGLEFKVGLFTILAMAATGYLFFAISPDSFESRKFKSYYTHLVYAAGIVPKTQVKTNGVSVGKVKDVQLGANNTKIIFEVDANVKIPKGSTLQVKSVGFLGDSHLEIMRGDDTGEYLADGGLIPQSTNASDLNSLIEVAGSIAKDIKKVTGNLADTMGTDDGREKIQGIVDNISDIASNFKGILVDNRADLRKFVQNLSEVMDDENKEKINRVIAAFDVSMGEVQSATKNINLIVERVEKGEGTLGKLVNDDKALEELQGAIKDIREVLAPANKLQLGVDAHIEARMNDETQTYTNIVFQTRPDRYYLVGFTDVQEEEINRRTKDTSDELDEDDNADRSERITTSTKKALRFNIQFAKRWYAVALRVGMFESTGGLAADFYLWRDRIKFTMEAFDWRSKENEFRRVAHLKAYASVLFFNHIYMMAGIDDPTKYETRGDPTKLQKPNYFMGAGLTFNDQDLKALFGAAAIMSL
jgi:phospholipid/cholesterol/gamma-HCH transport system substrate-binding protein